MVSRVSPKSLAQKSKRKNSHGNPTYSRGDFLDRQMLPKTLIPPDLDEDIDDDLAFDSDDERMYGHFFEREEKEKKSKKQKNIDAKTKAGKAKNRIRDQGGDLMEEHFGALERTEQAIKRPKSGSIHGNDDDLYNYHEDGQSSDGSDYIDLSDMLDANLAQEEETQTHAKKKKSSKKKAIVHDEERLIVKKKRAGKLRDETESFFAPNIAGEDGVAESYAAAIHQLIRKGDSSTKEEEAARNRLEEALGNKHNLLSVDLEDTEKERLTRKEVRTIVEQDLSKYKPLLKEINASKHLQLPMRAPESNPVPSSVGAIVAASEVLFSEKAPEAGKAAQKLTHKMNTILSRAGISRDQLEKASRHGSNTDSIGDYVQFDNDDGAENEAGEGASFGEPSSGANAPSIGYMAKLKAILAYENARRKRFNRIKSKTYRRILRKEKDRERERRQKAFELLHPELARKRLGEKIARARAEERVTQKHKNTSAWVKHAKRFAHMDVNVKDALNEQNALRHKLMQKADEEAGEDDHTRYVVGQAGVDDDDRSSEEERVVDELLAEMTADPNSSTGKKQPLTSVLWKSVEDDVEAGEASSPITKARLELREMKFMKNAREREEKTYAAELEALRQDIQQYQSAAKDAVDLNSDTSDDGGNVSRHASRRAGESVRPDETAKVTENGPGRRSFSTSASSKQQIETIQFRKQTGLKADPIHAEEQTSATNAFAGEEGILNTTQDLHHPRDSALASDGFAGDRKKMSRSTRITIKPETLKRPRIAEGLATHEKDGALAMPSHRDSPETSASLAMDNLRLQQEYLVSRAFAHDEIDEEFLKEKTGEVEMIMKPEDVNENLPGWGEWGGSDPKLNKRHREKLEHSALQKQIEKSFLLKSRADAALDHVIINHDGVELVPGRMTLHMIPRPFSNAQEFARFMRQPLGAEWSSALSFKERVQPRVEVHQGQAVLPLNLSLRRKTNKTKRRKMAKKDGNKE